MEKSKVNVFKTALLIGGAYSSYTIGSGFATGQEVLQFFGSWGGMQTIGAVAISLFMCIYFCISFYKTGQKHSFDRSIDSYQYYCGKYLGYAVDLFSVLLVFGVLVAMFAGAGATINEYFGLPVYVGSIGIGIVAAIVVLSGAKRVAQVLGFVGVLIILYVVGIGLLALAMKSGNFEAVSESLPKYVEEGKVLQAGVFGIYNWVLAGAAYGGIMLITGLPFYVSLGKQTRSLAEARGAGIFSGIFFHCGIALVTIAILLNLDFVISSGAQVPNLAAINAMVPEIAWTFAIILVLGIFTTITGYLWLVSGRFAKEGSMPAKVIIAVLVIAGVFGGSIIPFNLIINVLYPFAGLVGAIVFIFVVAKDIRVRVENKDTN